MNDTASSELRQFTQREWLEAMLRFREEPALWSAFEPICELWYEIVQCKFEDAREFDERWAEEDFELDVHIGQVRYRDLDWLRQTFEAQELADLALAVGGLARPSDQWEKIENEAHAVVVDRGRTTVIDILYGHKISAAASLALAGLPITESGSAEALAFLNGRVAHETARLRLMEREVARGGGGGGSTLH